MKPRVIRLGRIVERMRIVFIGRPSKWGNPFRILEHGTREECIEKYRVWIRTQPALLASIGDLTNCALACYCAPKACHGDVLVELWMEQNPDPQMVLDALVVRGEN